MTNREAHEKAAGMALEPLFFKLSDIDPDVIYPEGAHIPNQCYINYGRDLDGCSSQENGGCRSCILYRENIESKHQMTIEEAHKQEMNEYIKSAIHYLEMALNVVECDDKYNEGQSALLNEIYGKTLEALEILNNLVIEN